jgi:hypothetical protein
MHRQVSRDRVPGPANLLGAAVASHGQGKGHEITLAHDFRYRCAIAGNETVKKLCELKIEQCASAGTTAQT